MNLIETLGEDYMTEMCQGAYFMHGDRLMKYGRAYSANSLVRDVVAEEDEYLPNDVFAGWSVFRAEPSGYRRLGEHNVGYCTRLNSTRRGLRSDNVRVMPTPATRQLNATLGRTNAIPHDVKMRQFLRPTFDNIDECLPKLLRGEQLSVVLNENLVIEVASGGRADAWYHILNKTNVIGRLNRQGRATWNDPEQSILIPSLQAA